MASIIIPKNGILKQTVDRSWAHLAFAFIERFISESYP